ncbi:glb-12 [Pristionchus pacificus]|uniref:Glb-12 n=1 Tax=Pristionchus pacificus TaxID=54126 RepID=A0A2A6CZ41_PRIPA|nr:glb-12 [Pristionchus pacificus]|eukprot:PDM83380.1 glb-12 [Pristionchus pacificus]
MGLSSCKLQSRKQVGSSWVGNESENPFEIILNKKDRTCLRESFQRLQEPKEIVGLIFVDIVNDIEPDLRTVFGVNRAPKAAMLSMPKLGGHVARFTDLFEQITSMLGVSENLTGAWQLIRKTGRVHAKQAFLEQNFNQLEKNYFEIVLNVFEQRLIPYLTGEKEEPVPEGQAPRKVRFAQSYTPDVVTAVWKKFFAILVTQMTDAFELERTKMRNSQNQKTLAPHQHIENEVKKKKRISERQSEIEHTANSVEKGPEQLFEDPF